MSKETVVKTNCFFCPEYCGVNVHVRDGQITKVEGMQEHPVSHGKLCPKGASAKDWGYAPDRLLHPLKRENGGFKQISWDEALDIIAEKLTDIKQRYGARALATCEGRALNEQSLQCHGLIGRFCDVFGTPNRFSVEAVCYRPRVMGHILTYGKVGVAEIANSKCVVLWGNNPRNAMPVESRLVEEAREKGAKLLVIDPYRTYWAKKADVHAQPRPGSDCALALALLNVIITEELYDPEFVDNWTVGFDKLAEHVKSYPPEEAEKITGVPAQTIKDLARTWATTKPACLSQGGNTLDQQTDGVQIARAIAIIQAITGNIDVPGGWVRATTPLQDPIYGMGMRLLDRVAEKPLGTDEFPLFHEIFGTVLGDCQGHMVLDAILTGKPYPIKALMVSGANMVLTWPNANKVKEVLAKLEFLVVMDHFMTETAEFADLVLPAANWLERDNLIEYTYLRALPIIMLRQKAVEVGECWSDTNFYLRLAKRMGYNDSFPWENEDDVLDYVLQPSGLTVKTLREEHPAGITLGTIHYGEYKEAGFWTPSKKVEIYSETMAKHGYDPLPVHVEPLEGPISTPELAREYPLVLLHGGRNLQFLHSSLYRIPRLGKSMREPLAEIHPDTAAKYGIKDGDMAMIESKRGSVKMRAKVTDDILPGVLKVPHGWGGEANANLLTDEATADPLSGYPSKSVLCRMKRA